MVCTELPVSSKLPFSQWKIHFSQFIFIDEYIKFKEIEYFSHYFKFEMWRALFYLNSLYIQQWNSNWDIAFFNSFLDSCEMQNYVLWIWWLHFTLFCYSQKDWNLRFVNVDLVHERVGIEILEFLNVSSVLPNFPQSTKELEDCGKVF